MSSVGGRLYPDLSPWPHIPILSIVLFNVCQRSTMLLNKTDMIPKSWETNINTKQ